MEEVDKIILVTLRQIGCEIHPDVSSLKEFTADMVVDAVVTGLSFIDKEKKFEGKLPPEMSARYRVCSALAKACTEHGYRGEIGYHQFLYPSETETRRILMWLVEAIPKMEKSQEQEAAGSAGHLLRMLAGEAAERHHQGHVAHSLLPHGLYRSTAPQSWHFRSAKSFHRFTTPHLTVPNGVADVAVRLSKDERRYFEQFLPFADEQVAQHQELGPALMERNQREFVLNAEWEQEWNKHGLVSGLSKEDYKNRKKQKLLSKFSEQMKAASQRASREEGESLEKLVASYEKGVMITSRFSNQAKFAETEANLGEDEESLQKRREEEINRLRERVSELSLLISKTDNDRKNYETNLKQLMMKLAEEQAKTPELEAIYKIKKRTFDLLDDPEGNIKRLRQEIQSLSAKMIELSEQWEAKRVPLVDAYRTLRASKASRLAESRRQLQMIEEFKEQMKVITDEARSKNEIHKQLLEEYEKMPKDVQRAQYTERIMEILKNIQKQNVEISKVLLDTRQVQKEISTTLEQLNRTYAAADELVYRDAKTNEFSKKSYRLLVAIHETCGKISDNTSETGQMINASKDLEDKIAQLMQDQVPSKLEKILADFEQVKNENEALIQRIKKARLGV